MNTPDVDEVVNYLSTKFNRIFCDREFVSCVLQDFQAILCDKNKCCVLLFPALEPVYQKAVRYQAKIFDLAVFSIACGKFRSVAVCHKDHLLKKVPEVSENMVEDTPKSESSVTKRKRPERQLYVPPAQRRSSLLKQDPPDESHTKTKPNGIGKGKSRQPHCDIRSKGCTTETQKSSKPSRKPLNQTSIEEKDKPQNVIHQQENTFFSDINDIFIYKMEKDNLHLNYLEISNFNVKLNYRDKVRTSYYVRRHKFINFLKILVRERESNFSCVPIYKCENSGIIFYILKTYLVNWQPTRYYLYPIDTKIRNCSYKTFPLFDENVCDDNVEIELYVPVIESDIYQGSDYQFNEHSFIDNHVDSTILKIECGDNFISSTEEIINYFSIEAVDPVPLDSIPTQSNSTPESKIVSCDQSLLNPRDSYKTDKLGNNISEQIESNENNLGNDKTGEKSKNMVSGETTVTKCSTSDMKTDGKEKEDVLRETPKKCVYENVIILPESRVEKKSATPPQEEENKQNNKDCLKNKLNVSKEKKSSKKSEHEQEKEIMRKTKEKINRKTRPIIKYVDDTNDTLKIDRNEDNINNWEDLFDEDGHLQDDFLTDIAQKVGEEVTIVTAIEDYSPYANKSLESLEHVVELYGFPASFETHDIVHLFSFIHSDAMYIKWVDDTHALLVLGSLTQAQRALEHNSPLIKARPMSAASPAALEVANKSDLKPAMKRPQTNLQTARRLITTHLGAKSRVSKEQSAKEREDLKTARELKKLAKQNERDAWEGNLRSTVKH